MNCLDQFVCGSKMPASFSAEVGVNSEHRKLQFMFIITVISIVISMAKSKSSEEMPKLIFKPRDYDKSE